MQHKQKKHTITPWNTEQIAKVFQNAKQNSCLFLTRDGTKKCSFLFKKMSIAYAFLVPDHGKQLLHALCPWRLQRPLPVHSQTAHTNIKRYIIKQLKTKNSTTKLKTIQNNSSSSIKKKTKHPSKWAKAAMTLDKTQILKTEQFLWCREFSRIFLFRF